VAYCVARQPGILVDTFCRSGGLDNSLQPANRFENQNIDAMCLKRFSSLSGRFALPRCPRAFLTARIHGPSTRASTSTRASINTRASTSTSTSTSTCLRPMRRQPDQ